MTAFVLHPRLQADTGFVCDWPLCRVLLMNDSRFAWLILVPRVANAEEIFDLDADAQRLAMREVVRAGAGLKRWTDARKINVGALGNQVAQLHIHVVARKADDAAWPGPVWGAGQPKAYEDLDAMAARLRAAL